MMMAASRVQNKDNEVTQICFETKEVTTDKGRVLSVTGNNDVQSYKRTGELDDCSKQQKDFHQVLQNEIKDSLDKTIEVGSKCGSVSIKIDKSSQQTLDQSSKKCKQGKKNMKRMCANLSGTKYAVGMYETIVRFFFLNNIIMYKFVDARCSIRLH